MVKIKKYTVDGETRVGVWVDGQFKEEVDCCSDFSPAEAKKYLKEKYSK